MRPARSLAAGGVLDLCLVPPSITCDIATLIAARVGQDVAAAAQARWQTADG
jgi:hypothetical protein